MSLGSTGVRTDEAVRRSWSSKRSARLRPQNRVSMAGSFDELRSIATRLEIVMLLLDRSADRRPTASGFILVWESTIPARMHPQFGVSQFSGQ